jgi:hypothetical protein
VASPFLIHPSTHYLAKSLEKLGTNQKWKVCQFPQLYPKTGRDKLNKENKIFNKKLL